MPPTFSLLHTTARLPNGWIPAYQAFLGSCFRPQDVEYIVSVDRRDRPKWPGFEAAKQQTGRAQQTFGHHVLAVNDHRTCAVDGWNTAAEHSNGAFLITVADDLRAPARWDEEIRKLVPDMTKEVVLDVNYGPKAQAGFCFFSLFTRARYERLGYVFWPEYWGMYGDNDFTEHAILDRVLKPARHLTFPHLHYLYGLSPNDAVYRWQQRPEAFAIGQQVFERRRASRFGAVPRSPVAVTARSHGTTEAQKQRATELLLRFLRLADVGKMNKAHMREDDIEHGVAELVECLMSAATSKGESA